MSSNIDIVAERLRAAYAGGAVAPVREWLVPTDAAGAYAVQARRRHAGG